MAIRFLKSETIAQLLSHVEDDKDRYIKGSFSDYDIDSPLNSFESAGAVNIQELATLLLPSADNFFEPENSEIVFGAFRDLTRYQAADSRMWAYYSLMYGLSFVRKRYPAKFQASSNIEDLTEAVDMHFLKPNNSRNLIRNNILARLWWNARVVNDIDPRVAPEMLRALLINTDHRAQFMERPTQFSTNAFQAGLMYSLKKYKENNKNIYFDAPRSVKGAMKTVTHYNYRATTAFLNRLGGTVNLNLLKPTEIMHLVARDEESFYARVATTD